LLHHLECTWPISYSLRAHRLVPRVSLIHQNQTRAFSSAYLSGVYVILILRAWKTSHKGQQSLTKLNTYTSRI
jgi:hypothetical protein